MPQIKNFLPNLLIPTLLILASTPLQAQITPDNTLGIEASRLTPNVLINGASSDRIDGGATRGSNLFHSFTEFNIDNGQRVYFGNPSGIENILTRVTGGNASNIFGTLGVNGAANLFLINPNGIVFGQNASLDVRGSFVGTTANGIQIGNQGVFSATNPQAPPLLTINPSGLLFNQLNQGGITNQSQAPAGINSIGENVTGLRVADGQNLLLVGGNININGGGLRAYGGNIELAALAAPGTVELNIENNNLPSLAIPDGVERADISLSNGAEVNVRGANGGNIKINARNVNLTGESKLRTGIETGLGTPNSKSGDIVINATGTTTLTDKSIISNSVRERAFGKSGDVNITTGSLNLNKDALINLSTLGEGDAGNIFIQASDTVSLDSNTGIYSSVGSGAVGNAGSININASSLTLSDDAALATDLVGVFEAFSVGRGNGGNINIKVGSLSLNNSEFSASTSGQGNAGNVLIQAKDAVSLTGGSGIYSSVEKDAVGNGGIIEIQAGSLSLIEGSEVNTKILGQGNGGKIAINARDTISLDGFGKDSNIFSRIIGSVNPSGVGNAGDIQLTTSNLSVTSGALISSSTLGKGNAGSILIQAKDTISLTGDANIYGSVGYSGVGNGGDIQLTTSNLSVTNGALISSTFGKGNAGNININVGSLYLNNGELNASTFGQGNAGSILIQAKDTISLTGGAKIFSYVEKDAVGNGGSIKIQTGSVSLTEGSEINTRNLGQGNGGKIAINARDTISLDGFGNNSNIFSRIISAVNPSGVGNAGDIQLTTGNFSATNGAFISSSTLGNGDAGNIIIDASGTISFDTDAFAGSSVSTGVVGKGGNIQITTGSLAVTKGGRLSSGTSGKGNAGNISILATDKVSLANGSSINSSISETGVGNAGNIDIFAKSFSVSGESLIFNSNLGGKGNAGNISINTQDNVSFTGGSSLSNGTLGVGDAGNIKIQAGGAVTISGGSETLGSGIASGVLETGIGNSGDIEIVARNLELSNGAKLFTFSNGKGNAGSVLITTLGTTTIKDSAIATFATDGNAGKITIRAGGDVLISEKSVLFSILSPNAVGKGGDIEIQGRNFYLSDGAALASATIGKGDAGNVLININNDISFTNGSQVRADTLGQGNAGNVTLNAGGTVLFDGMGSDGSRSGIATQVTTEGGFTGKGEGGDININAPTLLITNHGVLTSSSTGQGNAGNININTGTVSLDNEGIIAAQTNSGNGGNISLTATDLLLLRRNSNISTTAGLVKSGGDGGNININTPFIVAVPNENSDITGNAFTGAGGNINIRTQSIFGIEARQKPSDTTNDITASSELGVQGQIAITQPEVQPTQGLIQLPDERIDASNQIGQICPKGSYAKKPLGEFIVSGRGSLPPSPLQSITGTPNLIPLATLEGDAGTGGRSDAGTQRDAQITLVSNNGSSAIIEAQGFARTPEGKIIIVAYAPQATPSSRPTAAACPTSN
ncbi:MAG: filamentous hemagglutinin N-terminal domain-containing protein [Nostoc sp. NMS8]|nr:filamentous hemagglutinin N-terminal domain-containing protein [Nostoc sp. NMS8]